jgi:putative ABC transport system permease protein
MFKNYFKIAIAVLKRRKFFTFISLFGISFTLTVLMVATAFVNKVVSSDYPDLKRDRCLYVNRVEMRNTKEGWYNQSSPSYYLAEHYISTLKVPQKISISSFSRRTNAYVNDKKIFIEYQFTNADYWTVGDFIFLEGKPYTQQQISNAERVAVISESTKKAYFGDVPVAVGKYIEADNVSYRVIGVVKGVSKTMQVYYADLYLPYTVSKTDYKRKSLMGDYKVILLAGTKVDVSRMKQEFNAMIAKVPIDNKQYDKMYIHADGAFEDLCRRMVGDGLNSGVFKLVSLVGLVVFLFLLLPTINLVNINITRIMERSSEIGVRKAFGASSRTLVYQFIVENLILTFIGGGIGLIFSILVIYQINALELIPNLDLRLNVSVLLYSLLACLFFGLLSGVYPAWRMSRLNVVRALKS